MTVNTLSRNPRAPMKVLGIEDDIERASGISRMRPQEGFQGTQMRSLQSARLALP